jgi:hypothetical protein
VAIGARQQRQHGATVAAFLQRGARRYSLLPGFSVA